MTDSTASFPPGTPEAGITVVPLHVIAGDSGFDDGIGIEPPEVALRLSAGEQFTTSQPSRQALCAAYDEAAAQGASAVVAIHLSARLSGTARGAEIAALKAPLPVQVIDSRTSAMALGFAALAARDRAAAGGSLDAVAAHARAVAASSRAGFMVDSLDHLRRGGRISTAAAALGSVFGVRPLLAVRDGSIDVVRKVRTRRAAVDRLVSAALDTAAGYREPVFAVHFVGDDQLAKEVAEQVTAERGTAAGVGPAQPAPVPVVLSPLSAVLAAHVGPGALAVVVADYRPIS